MTCTAPQAGEEAQVPGEDLHLSRNHSKAMSLLDKVQSGPLWTTPYQLDRSIKDLFGLLTSKIPQGRSIE